MNEYVVLYQNNFTNNLGGRSCMADTPEKAIDMCCDIDKNMYTIMGVVKCEELL